jgi:hypothetical protein
MDGVLAVHLIGAGVGESIVLEFPNGNVGVVDCFSPRLKVGSVEDCMDVNPTLRFLVEDLHADSLAFIALTHPHEDHARGLSYLLQYFKDAIGEIWIFPAYQENYLDNYFKALFKNKRKLPCEKLFTERPGFFYLEFIQIRNSVHRQCDRHNSKRARFRRFSGYETFRLQGEPVKIHFLGPTAWTIEEYRASIVDNLRGIIDQDDWSVTKDWQPGNVNHNRVSPSLLVEFDRTRLILGGDMEHQAWKAVLEEQQDTTVDRPPLACHFVKVSHHGSTNGYCDGLYKAFAANGSPLGALTPFSRQRNPLPQRGALVHLATHVRELLCTNVEHTPKSEDRAMRESRPLSSRWTAILCEHPEWAGVLDPAMLDPRSRVSPVKLLPPELIPLLRANPGLTESLRADLQEQLPTRAFDRVVEEEYRLSFFFNSQGQELKRKRYVGAGAGQVE